MDHEKIAVGLLFSTAAIAAAWYFTRGSGSGSGNVLDFPPTPDPGSSGGNPPADAGSGGWVSTTAQEVINKMTWTTPAKGQQYEQDFKAAEAAYGLPSGLLSRVAYQESRYNPAAKSPVGALGLMQFMPATARELGFDPLDAKASIWAAAKYLSGLYKQFGNWTQALAAYNWGPGNVARKGIKKAPLETTNYFSQILADLGMDLLIG